MKEKAPEGAPVPQPSESVASVAMTIAAAMIANHVAGRATRDALFFSNFDVTTLPKMLLVASLFTVMVAVFTSRAMARRGPRHLISWSFGISGLLLMLEWPASMSFPGLTAVVVYLHLAVAGAFLISGFWSVVNEQFDPRTAKRHIGQIAGGGTLGGLVGGLLAERVAATLGVAAMFPLLASMHFFCAWRLARLGGDSSGTSRSGERSGSSGLFTGLKHLARAPYMRSLSLLVLLGALSATLLDYVFKAQAVATLEGGEDLLRFFAVFYTGVGLLTFLVQTSLSRLALEQLGLAKTVAVLPGGVALGALGMLVVPGLGSAAASRAGESVLRSSLFRSAYELLYTPVSPQEKRTTKPIIDVGFDRLGDALGASSVALLLLLGPRLAHPAMLIVAVGLAGLGLWITRSLHQGYVNALERSLLDHAVEVDLSEVEDRTTRQTVMQTLASLDVSSLREAAERVGVGDRFPAQGLSRPPLQDRLQSMDPVLQPIAELRSGDLERVHRVLSSHRPLELHLVPHAIQLLAWDEVSSEAIQALRGTGQAITGQLIDALVDLNQDFGIRRRIPRILAAFDSQRSVEGLWLGLEDKRFEVRFQSGQALASIRRKSKQIRIPRERVFDRVLREVGVDRRVWENQRLLDQVGVEEADNPLVDEYLRQRASRSLEHVFTLLSLALPQEPLRIAFRGLHTDDQALRGTALEYLESVLPAPVRQGLWTFLEDDRKDQQIPESREEILAALMQSNQSIELKLAELSRKVE